MSTFTTGNSIVDEVGCMHFSGNVIPQRWYKNILKDTGKPDLLAIVILADILYWYRPREERDEATGQLIGVSTRFHSDLLQRDYNAFAEQFGENKRNIRDAMTRLEKLGVIKREFRTVVTPTGLKCSNVLFIKLIPSRLYEVTHDRKPSLPMTKKCNRVCMETPMLLQKNDTPCAKECSSPIQNYVIGHTENDRTNTENNRENNTEIISSSSISPPTDEDDFKKQIGYKKAFAVYKDTATALYDEIWSDRSIDKADLTEQSFMELCRNVSEYSAPIRNLRPYIRTCLTNMEAGKKVKRKNSFNSHLKQGYDMAELEKNILAN